MSRRSRVADRKAARIKSRLARAVPEDLAAMAAGAGAGDADGCLRVIDACRGVIAGAINHADRPMVVHIRLLTAAVRRAPKAMNTGVRRAIYLRSRDPGFSRPKRKSSASKRCLRVCCAIWITCPSS
jgi:hypothetical protein